MKGSHDFKPSIFVAAFLLTCCGSATSLRAQSLIELGTALGNFEPVAINNSDQVAGDISPINGGLPQAALYSGGSITALGTLGGSESDAVGIDEAGQVAGFSTTSSNGEDAFLYSGGTLQDLGTFGSQYSSASAISNSGLVAVTTEPAGDSEPNLLLYSGGTATNLGAFALNNVTGINNSGQMIGSLTTNGSAFLYSAGTLTNLGTLPGDNLSEASGINNSGQVVGTSFTNGGPGSAFLYSNGQMTSLGNLPGDNSTDALGINDTGEIVGYSGASGIGDNSAYLYTNATGMQNLNTLYSSLLVREGGQQKGFVYLGYAYQINNSGDVVGEGEYWNGTSISEVGFLLKPGGGFVIPANTQTSVLAGGTYSAVTPATSTGGLGTTVSLVGGTNTTGSSQTVTLSTTNLGANFKSLASDVVSVSGNDGSIFAVQLTFDLNAANKVGGASNMSLLWLNPNSQWTNAVLGDHGTNDASLAELDFQGSFAQFQAEYGTDLSLYLGAYGVDTTNDDVWAVIDHNSDFGVGNLSELPEAVSTPEPSTSALLLGGPGLLAFWRKRALTDRKIPITK